MRLEVKRNALIIVPECDQDKAFIEDTIKLKSDGDKVELSRVNNVSMGFQEKGEYVLKLEVK